MRKKNQFMTQEDYWSFEIGGNSDGNTERFISEQG